MNYSEGYWLTLGFIVCLYVTIKVLNKMERNRKAQPILFVDDSFIYAVRPISLNRQIAFDSIGKIDLSFTQLRKGRLNKDKGYHTELIVTLANEQQRIRISDKYHSNSIWRIIKACRERNERSDNPIHISMVIPHTEQELHTLLNGWREQSEGIEGVISNLRVVEMAHKMGTDLDSAKEHNEYVHGISDKIKWVIVGIFLVSFGLSVVTLLFGMIVNLIS